jgi:hypothetical protein
VIFLIYAWLVRHFTVCIYSEIFSFFFLSEICGNHPIWDDLIRISVNPTEVPLPNKLLKQTLRNVWAVLGLGKKKCCKCGIKCLRVIDSIGLTICRRCQHTILLTTTELKVHIFFLLFFFLLLPENIQFETKRNRKLDAN